MSSNNFMQKVQWVGQRIVLSFKGLPIITKSMIVLVALFYFLNLMADLSKLALYPIGESFNPLQILTYSFLEFSFLNTLFSIIALWLFAAPIEHYWERNRFLIYLAVSVVSIAVLHLLLSEWFLSGSSGVIYSILLAYGMMWPEKRIQLLLPPIPVKGKYLVLVFGVLMALGYLQSTWGRWALLCYFGGAFCCFLLIQFWRQKPPFNKPKKNHLKRVK